jgi:serine/threonine protein kinase
MKNLNNEYIMKLEEIHESKNSIYLMLELLEGGELFGQISSKKTIGISSIQRILLCLLKALDYLDT